MAKSPARKGCQGLLAEGGFVLRWLGWRLHRRGPRGPPTGQKGKGGAISLS